MSEVNASLNSRVRSSNRVADWSWRWRSCLGVSKRRRRRRDEQRRLIRKRSVSPVADDVSRREYIWPSTWLADERIATNGRSGLSAGARAG